MFNNHILSIVTDLSILGQHIANADILKVVAVSTEPLGMYNNVYRMPNLVPPIDILNDLVNGDQNAAMQYCNHLLHQDQDTCIVGIIAALIMKNVVIYIPEQDFNVFGMLFIQHLNMVYGINAASPLSQQFTFNPLYKSRILDKMYLYDLMGSAMDYLALYQTEANLPMNPLIINKLAAELRPPVEPARWYEYFNGILRRKPIVNMVEVIQ